MRSTRVPFSSPGDTGSRSAVGHRSALSAAAAVAASTRRVSRRRSLRVLLAGGAGAMNAPGGGEVQLLATADALRALDVEPLLAAPTPQRLATADCLHLFGSLPEHLPAVAAARRAGIPVVLSTIAWFALANCWREPWPWVRRATAAARFLARAACPGLPGWRRRLYRSVDRLLPNSQGEAEQLLRYFRIPAEQIRIVPNGADPRMAHGEPEAFVRRFGVRRFALCPGRIEPRKNQLGLIRAMRRSRLPLVVLGDVVPGHESYLAQCRREAGPCVRFLPRIDHHDPLLAAAYAACACLVLPSWFETPGLVALEAAMSGTPLVLTSGGCAREYFGEQAAYVAPGDEAGIRRAVERAAGLPRNPGLARLVREGFSWAAAAEASRSAYESVV